MRTLYLLRHAKSSWKDTSLEDFDRPLNKRGRQAAKAMAGYFIDRGVRPATILCSSATRTRETLERMQKKLGPNIPVRFEKGIYLASANTMLRRLRRLDDGLASAMIVGHNPGMERLALMLAGDDGGAERSAVAEKYPTGALCVLDLDIAHWRDAAPGCAHIAAFVRPRDLDPG